MKLLDIIIAGMVGTALMTAFMYAMTFVTQRVMKVVKILGTMLTFRTTPDGRLSDSRGAIAVGLIAHYAVGVVFMLVYYWLWTLGIGRPDLRTSLLFGVVSGVVAIGIWYAFFAIHPRPPAISLPPYLFTLALAHIVFAVAAIETYRWLQA